MSPGPGSRRLWPLALPCALLVTSCREVRPEPPPPPPKRVSLVFTAALNGAVAERDLEYDAARNLYRVE